MHFQVRCNGIDHLQNVVVDFGGAVQKIPRQRIGIDESGHAFFAYCRPPSVLDFILLRIALALAAEELARDGRPAEHRRVREMKDIVEAIAVVAVVVIGQRIANLFPFDVKSKPSVGLAELDCKVARNLLLRPGIFVEEKKLARSAAWPPTGNLEQIVPSNGFEV